MKQIFLILVTTICLQTFAEGICNVCLYTPYEVTELYTGKGGSIDGQVHVEKLAKPIFSGELFYSVDNSVKAPLPSKRGVFFTLNDSKKHKIDILSGNDKSWGIISFKCDEYKFGTKIKFESGSTYGPAWRTYPLPKDLKKCPWHPENQQH